MKTAMFHSSQPRMGQLPVDLFLVLILLTWPLFTLPASTELPAEQRETLQTLIAGLRHRESLIQSISGTAIQSHYHNEGAWETIWDIITEEAREERQKGIYGDRDRALIRFRLGRHQWFYDVQQLWWSGWGSWFLGDFQRQPQEVADLYQRKYCDGNRLYLYKRCKDTYPVGSGTMTPLGQEKWGFLRGPFSKWFALGTSQTYSTQIEDALTDGRVVEIKEEIWETLPCYKVTWGLDLPGVVDDIQLWIARDYEFAIVRREILHAGKGEWEGVASRRVLTWSDFQPFGGEIYLPQHFREIFIRVGPGISTDTPAIRIDDVELMDLAVDQSFQLGPLEVVFPVGAIFDLPTDSLISVDERRQSEAPWLNLKDFAVTPFPMPDESLLKFDDNLRERLLAKHQRTE